MPLTENAAPILALALSDLLGPVLPGSMAFIRCLPGEVARELAADERFSVLGWQIAAVSQAADEAARSITADKAVEWREDKREAVLLLVDTVHAGAGMDGIYSAAREIAEAQLFASAKALARAKLPRGGKSFADKALAKARRMARNKALSPWREFTYLCRAVHGLKDLGAALPEIGLWPVAVEDKPDDGDLEKSALLVERLLARQGNRQSAEARVVGLQLPAADAAVERELAEFLRAADSVSRLDALARLEGQESLWLNRLRPGLFDSETLQSIRWVNWRQGNGKPYQWAGLAVDGDKRLTFRLALVDNPQQRVRLEVRWEVEPATLAKGAVDYIVDIRAGGDALAEKTVTHAARGLQKCVFTQDDFGDLEGSERFEAEVAIRALTAEASREGDAAPSSHQAHTKRSARTSSCASESPINQPNPAPATFSPASHWPPFRWRKTTKHSSGSPTIRATARRSAPTAKATLPAGWTARRRVCCARTCCSTWRPIGQHIRAIPGAGD